MSDFSLVVLIPLCWQCTGSGFHLMRMLPDYIRGPGNMPFDNWILVSENGV